MPDSKTADALLHTGFEHSSACFWALMRTHRLGAKRLRSLVLAVAQVAKEDPRGDDPPPVEHARPVHSLGAG